MSHTYNLRSIDKSLYNDYKTGRKTLHECARAFYLAGWDNFVNEDATARRFYNLSKLNNND